MLTAHKDFFNKLLGGLGRVLAKLPIHPNALTLLGLVLGIACCIYLVITRDIAVFCILVFFAGIFDLFDGLLARATGKTSKFGAYLDAMTDRFFDILVLITVAYVTGYWLLSSLVILGAYSTSYAKARAAMEIPIENNEWPDFLERTERAIFYVVGLFVSQVFKIEIWGHDIFWWVLVLLVIGTHITVLQRILRAKKLIEARR